jgi:hypothetical protein
MRPARNCYFSIRPLTLHLLSLWLRRPSPEECLACTDTEELPTPLGETNDWKKSV